MFAAFTDNPVIDTILGIALVLGALGVIWRVAIRPLVHGVNTIAEVAPILTGIAEEFKPNGGSSLRDVVNRIEGKADNAVTAAESAVTAATTAATHAELAVTAASTASEHAAKAVEISEHNQKVLSEDLHFQTVIVQEHIDDDKRVQADLTSRLDEIATTIGAPAHNPERENE